MTGRAPRRRRTWMSLRKSLSKSRPFPHIRRAHRPKEKTTEDSDQNKTFTGSFACAVKRARNSSGRRISHPATVAPAGSNRSVRSGQLLRAKPSVQKVAEKAISERAGHNMSERRASLEKGNVNAELVRNKRRPPSLRKASDKSTAEEHRGIGDGMCAKEGCVNTGSPMPRAGVQPEAREGEAGRHRVAERSVVARMRVTTVERRDLTFRGNAAKGEIRTLGRGRGHLCASLSI